MRRMNRGLLGDQGTEDTKEFESLIESHGFPENDHGLSDVDLSRVPMWSKILRVGPCVGSTHALRWNPERKRLFFTSDRWHEWRERLVSTLWFQQVQPYVGIYKTKDLCTADCKITDSSGNPAICSAVLNYRVCDGKQSLMNVQNVDQFVRTNATAVLKQIVSRHTYDECKKEASEMNMLMRTLFSCSYPSLDTHSNTSVLFVRI